MSFLSLSVVPLKWVPKTDTQFEESLTLFTFPDKNKMDNSNTVFQRVGSSREKHICKITLVPSGSSPKDIPSDTELFLDV